MNFTQRKINRYFNKHKKNVYIRAIDVGNQFVIIGEFVHPTEGEKRGSVMLDKFILNSANYDILADTLKGF